MDYRPLTKYTAGAGFAGGTIIREKILGKKEKQVSGRDEADGNNAELYEVCGGVVFNRGG